MSYEQPPSIDTRCDLCGHAFGDHYLSFNGRRSGCLNDDQRDGNCACKGFALVYRPRAPFNPTAEDYYNK